VEPNQQNEGRIQKSVNGRGGGDDGSEESGLEEEDVEYFGTPRNLSGFMSAAQSGYIWHRKSISFTINSESLCVSKILAVCPFYNQRLRVCLFVR
jgi:hypothetical protein